MKKKAMLSLLCIVSLILCAGAVPGAEPTENAQLHPSDQGGWLSDASENEENRQMLLVQAEGTSALISFHERREDGTWDEIFSTSGYVGEEGIGQADAFHAITPEGIFTLGQIFGIQENPGTQLPYIQVDDTWYWCGDSLSEYYNQFVSTKEVTGFDYEESEHIIDYGAVYNYCIDMGFNTECTPYGGAAFFVHCENGTPTGGCVSMPEEQMITLIQHLKEGAQIAIGDQDFIEDVVENW